MVANFLTSFFVPLMDSVGEFKTSRNFQAGTPY